MLEILLIIGNPSPMVICIAWNHYVQGFSWNHHWFPRGATPLPTTRSMAMFFQARGRRTSFCGHFGGPLVLTPCFKVSQTVSFFCRSMAEPKQIHWLCMLAPLWSPQVGTHYDCTWLFLLIKLIMIHRIVYVYTYTHTQLFLGGSSRHDSQCLWSLEFRMDGPWNCCQIQSLLHFRWWIFFGGRSGQVLLVFNGESEKDMVQNCCPPKFVEVSDPKNHPQTVPSLWHFFRRQEWLPTGTVTCGRVSAPISPTSKQAPVVQFSVRVHGDGLSCLMLL